MQFKSGKLKKKKKLLFMFDVIIIGAGITGLTCAYQLRRKGLDVLVLEQQDRVGGQINSVREGDFIFEAGPNTGVVKYPEVAELFEQLGDRCTMEVAQASSKCRLIWKGDRFHPLPSGLGSAIATPLFRWHDKFRILGEPWRKRGTDPNESVGSLAQRRLGKSFVDYAVDPFLSGVYAGDPYQLPTRWALPKLYALEQEHGSFVRGSLAKARQPKSERDRKATKKVFSARGGFSTLVHALADEIGRDRLITSAHQIQVQPDGQGHWTITYQSPTGGVTLQAAHVVTTCGAYSLPDLLPFVEEDVMADLSHLYYAPVVQVGVGIQDGGGVQWRAFGGLVPSRENRDMLGILFPSACFTGRAPERGAAMAYFVGGTRHPEYLDWSDAQLQEMVNRSLHEMLGYPADKVADAIRIFRHPRAIPQYDTHTPARLAAIERVQQQYPTLTIAGNLRDGIGIGDRIKQGMSEAEKLDRSL